MSRLKTHLTASAERCNFRQILFTTHDEVDAMILNGVEYPAIWFMLPFSYKKIKVDGIKAKQWNIEFLVLHAVERDLTADELIRQYTTATALLDSFLHFLENDSIASDGRFIFDEDDTDEIHPKLRHTVDNSIGWYVETKITELTT